MPRAPKVDIAKLGASLLRGASVRPADPAHFNGVVFVPSRFVREEDGEDRAPALERYLDWLDETDDIFKRKGGNA